MSTEFALNFFSFGDVAGEGQWMIGHFRQHLRYNDKLAARTPPVILPEFSIIAVEGGANGRRGWLEAHSNWHRLLRPIANVTGIDLATVDMDDEEQFYAWMDSHNEEHGFMDIIFGVA
jgi:hypothetical protein